MSVITPPLVSIALCTFNGERHLAEQLQSIVNQSYTNIEVLVSDDDSSDDTLSILKSFASSYPFIKIQKNPNRLGYVKNYESVIRRCEGKYIALADQDDIWDLDKIKIQVENIGNNVLIYHDSALINDNGEPLNIHISNLYNMYQGNDAIPFYLVNCISGHSILFERKLIDEFLPIPNQFYHDWWIALFAADNGGITYYPSPLVQYRQHGASSTDILKLKNKVVITQRTYFNPHVLQWIRCFGIKSTGNAIYNFDFISCFDTNNRIKNKSKLLFLMIKKYHLLLFRSKKSNISKLNLIRRTIFQQQKLTNLSDNKRR